MVNAHHTKAVPGRKADVKDAEWIAKLLQHGLLIARCSPDKDQAGACPLPQDPHWGAQPGTEQEPKDAFRHDHGHERQERAEQSWSTS